MSSNINTFLANFRDGARPNRFRVIVTWPTAVGTPNVRDEIVVKAASMPASTIGKAHVNYRGRQIPLPGDRTFEDWSMTVMNDISHSHRNAFERWSNLILGFEGNIQNAPDYKSLTATIEVQQLDRSDNVLKTCKLLNAFPSTISAIELNYETEDSIEDFTVSFAYTHWESANSPTS